MALLDTTNEVGKSLCRFCKRPISLLFLGYVEVNFPWSTKNLVPGMLELFLGIFGELIPKMTLVFSISSSF